MGAASAADAAIQKKIYGSRMTALVISNEEVDDVMKIVKFVEESGLLIKGVGKANENETKKSWIFWHVNSLVSS